MAARKPTLTPVLLGVLGFTGAVGPLAVDMYLPSFGVIQQDLNTTASLVQLTLSVFFLGTAAGQLFIGPLSDLLGRRTPLLTALSIYAVASVVLVFTPTIELFIGLRLLLGFTGAAGIVLARAIAVDLSDGVTAVRALSLIAMVGGLGPLLAPALGGITQVLWGWRGTLATLAALSVLMLVLAWLLIPESLPIERRHTTKLRNMFAPLGRLVRRQRYVYFMLSFVFGFGSLIAYVAASPFVGQNLLGMSPLLFSLGFAIGGAAIIICNTINAKIAPRVGPATMLRFGVVLLVVAGIAMCLLTLTGALAAWSFITTAFVLTAGAGFTMSNASALALAEASDARGSGAALLGSTQFGLSAAFAPLVGAWGEMTAVPMGIVVLCSTLVACLCALLGIRAQQQHSAAD